jgi:hypothetical protein
MVGRAHHIYVPFEGLFSLSHCCCKGIETGEMILCHNFGEFFLGGGARNGIQNDINNPGTVDQA